MQPRDNGDVSDNCDVKAQRLPDKESIPALIQENKITLSLAEPIKLVPFTTIEVTTPSQCVIILSDCEGF